MAWVLLGAIPARGRGPREVYPPTPTGAWHRGLPQSAQGQEVLAGGESGRGGPARRAGGPQGGGLGKEGGGEGPQLAREGLRPPQLPGLAGARPVAAEQLRNLFS